MFRTLRRNNYEVRDQGNLGDSVKHALNQLKKINGNIVNIDMTIICEKPKIQKYKNKMINKISKLTGLNITNINIKGTTTEGLGFLGRKEGIACQTIILINLK